jgi:predicted MPP superfamily phosphohydrolase
MMLGDDFLEKVLARLRGIKPDIVVATGDIVDGQGNNLDELAARLSEIKPPMGAFAVIGNHEYYAGLDTSIRFLRNAGFTVLRGESAEAGGIVFVGVDDPSAEAASRETMASAAKALAMAPRDRFVVLLKHQPVVDLNSQFDLQLSGHIHGGQMFPFGLVTRLVYGVHTGLTELADGRRLYVSRGAGTWGPPMRILAAPEITLIRMESARR